MHFTNLAQHKLNNLKIHYFNILKNITKFICNNILGKLIDQTDKTFELTIPEISKFYDKLQTLVVSELAIYENKIIDTKDKKQ